MLQNQEVFKYYIKVYCKCMVLIAILNWYIFVLIYICVSFDQYQLLVFWFIILPERQGFHKFKVCELNKNTWFYLVGIFFYPNWMLKQIGCRPWNSTSIQSIYGYIPTLIKSRFIVYFIKWKFMKSIIFLTRKFWIISRKRL